MICVSSPVREAKCSITICCLSTAPSLPEPEQIAALCESVVAACLDACRWRRARFLTRTCRRGDQTGAKPNTRPVNIAHPSPQHIKWGDGLLRALKFVIPYPPPRFILLKGNSVTYRMSIPQDYTLAASPVRASPIGCDTHLQ